MSYMKGKIYLYKLLGHLQDIVIPTNRKIVYKNIKFDSKTTSMKIHRTYIF